MTSSTKMLTSAEKNTPGSNFCSNPIKDILNKSQTEFGYKTITNRENSVGVGPNNPNNLGRGWGEI